LPDSNEAVLRAAVEAFNDATQRERYLDLYDPEVVLHGYPRGLVGLEGAKAFYAQLWTALPDAKLTIEDVIADGDRLAARYRLSGVRAREFYGAPGTGNATEAEGIAWLRFRDRRVVEVWQSSGTLDTVLRLAARPPERPRPSASAEAAALRWEERQDQ
jgi:predicted ester cyclase